MAKKNVKGRKNPGQNHKASSSENTNKHVSTLEQKPFLEESLVHKKEEKSKFSSFLVKQKIEISFKRYFIDALGAMALGLFASLLIGTILSTFTMILPEGHQFTETISSISSFASQATGAAMAIAIAYALQAPPLVMFSLVAVGLMTNSLGGAGGPLAVFVVAILACELGKLVSKTTPVDILLTPLVTLLSGGFLAMLVAPSLGSAANQIGRFVVFLTQQQPFLMGIMVSVVMGILLTLPISSAAIAASFGLVGFAGGAALAGCCAQMVGFAVISYKENKFGGLLAQGLGTSMLQMPNIMRKPRIFLPPILASAITGPIATSVFRLEMNGAAIASGMGTSGLVGPIGLLSGWIAPSEIALEYGASAQSITLGSVLAMLLICVILPAIFSYLFYFLFRRMRWIEDGDLKISL